MPIPIPFLSGIRYIYFDFDNVLATRAENRSRLVAHMLGLPHSARLRQFYFVSFHNDLKLEQRYLHLQTVAEEMAFYRDLFKMFATRERVAVSESQLAAAAEAFVHVPLQVATEVITGLQMLQKTYTLGILSNGLPSRRQEILTSGLAPYFANTIISCDYNIEKPAQAIYAHAFAATGLPASNIALIDDEPANITGAQAAGFGQAVLFTPAFWQQVQPEVM